jgi:hypothetical protein
MLLIVAVTLSAGLVAYLVRDGLCRGALSIGACSPALLGLLLASVPLVSVLRGIVMAQLAADRDRIALVLAIPALGFLGWGIATRPDMEGLALGFLCLATATVALYVALSVARAGSGRLKAGSA